MVERHINLIRKIVWGYVKGNPGLEFDDLFSEACLACIEAQKKYDPTRGKESTFLWVTINNRLCTILGEQAKIRAKEIPASIEDMFAGEHVQSPERRVIDDENWQEFLKNLSPDGRMICSLLFSDSMACIPSEKPKKCKTIIKEELRLYGWTDRKIRQGFREIHAKLV